MQSLNTDLTRRQWCRAKEYRQWQCARAQNTHFTKFSFLRRATSVRQLSARYFPILYTNSSGTKCTTQRSCDGNKQPKAVIQQYTLKTERANRRISGLWLVPLRVAYLSFRTFWHVKTADPPSPRTGGAGPLHR